MLAILQYSFIERGLIAGLIIAIIAPLIGIFLVLRRYSLIADTLSHVSFAGVALGLALSALLAFLINHFHWIHLAQEVYLISELPLEFKPAYALFVFLYAIFLSLLLSLIASLRTNTQKLLFTK